MTPDVKLKDYYLKFIRNVNNDISKYREQLVLIKEKLSVQYETITNYYDFYKNNYDINLNDYSEYSNKNYNPSNTLYVKINKFINIEEDAVNRNKLHQITKYCNLLRNKYDTLNLINLTNERKKLSFSKYREIVFNYYNKVHKCVLEGNGYKFNYGIGIFCINRWKVNQKAIRPRIDYNETRLRKQELIAQGKKIYNENQAAWYEARGIPYDGIDYRVFKTETHTYEMTFIKSNILSKSAIQFKHAEYINIKHRGKSYTQMADICKTFDDIINFQVDIKYKLNMMLYKYPNTYMNFIRNAEQEKYNN